MPKPDHPDSPAYPSHAWTIWPGGEGNTHDHDNGLSTRLYVATRCLAALLVEDCEGRLDRLARRAVQAADELLAVLRESQPSQARPDVTATPPGPSVLDDLD